MQIFLKDIKMIFFFYIKMIFFYEKVPFFLIFAQYILTRNKNTRHIFPRHFLTVAMIGIKCLYMHFVLYIFHTQSLFSKYLHYFRSYNNPCSKCTCTSCAPTARLFDAKNLFLRLLCSSTEQTSYVKKDQLYHLKCQSKV